MSGIYIHIPFCKQACHYCDFHFSTNFSRKNDMVKAIKKEIMLRKTELQNIPIETIYFGGGTPSVLSVQEILQIIQTIKDNYTVIQNPEITLEANPDDLDEATILQLANSLINRLSIGVQSFFEEDLQLMNRAHNATDADKSVLLAKQYFDNISVDLIYGMPNMTNLRWQQNLQKALELKIPHISSYALTVEPKTALHKMVQTKKVTLIDEELVQEQFHLLVNTLENNGFIHYEMSNFGKPNYFSKNNSAYWQGKYYLGIGPSAHSFNGISRSWNTNNNIKYIHAIEKSILPSESENLTITDRYNEYIMTGLRTMWGVSFNKIEKEFGERYLLYLLDQIKPHVENNFLQVNNQVLTTTLKGKFLSDGIASDLFLLNLE
jgi:oxygen-independent coproporphyrinogen III oxidase